MNMVRIFIHYSYILGSASKYRWSYTPNTMHTYHCSSPHYSQVSVFISSLFTSIIVHLAIIHKNTLFIPVLHNGTWTMLEVRWSLALLAFPFIALFFLGPYNRCGISPISLSTNLIGLFQPYSFIYFNHYNLMTISNLILYLQHSQFVSSQRVVTLVIAWCLSFASGFARTYVIMSSIGQYFKHISLFLKKIFNKLMLCIDMFCSRWRLRFFTSAIHHWLSHMMDITLSCIYDHWLFTSPSQSILQIPFKAISLLPKWTSNTSWCILQPSNVVDQP